MKKLGLAPQPSLPDFVPNRPIPEGPTMSLPARRLAVYEDLFDQPANLVGR